MPVRLLEVFAPKEAAEAVETALAEAGALDVWRAAAREREQNGEARRSVLRALIETGCQDVIDAAQDALSGYEDWRILILPVDAAIPEPEKEKDEENEAAKEQQVKVEAREVLYNTVCEGAALNLSQMLFVLFSTLVAVTGLALDNVAVLIGAMVIAPFLGPNLAFALGAALGDKQLMWDAAKTLITGMAAALAPSILAGLAFDIDVTGDQIKARTTVDFDVPVVALASGAAAALGLVTGAASSLVGVMVAVALLPPVVTLGIMLGAGELDGALWAAVLLIANIASVNLAALAVFTAHGVSPRSWLEQYAARQSSLRAWVAWALLLALVILAIAARRFDWIGA